MKSIESVSATPVWKTVKLGTYKDVGALKMALESAGCRVHKLANEMLVGSEFTLATEETEADLVVLTVADLGFEDGAEYYDICTKSVSLGLQLCPAEVGPQMLLQFRDQLNEERLNGKYAPPIGMKALHNAQGFGGFGCHFFRIMCGGYNLYVGDGCPSNYLSAGTPFAFVLPRK
jgi:hypothetical protein